MSDEWENEFSHHTGGDPFDTPDFEADPPRKVTTYSCLLCGTTTPLPHVCPEFSAATPEEEKR